MPDPDPLLETRPRRTAGFKIIAIAACGVIASLGLCQLGFYLGRDVHDGAPSTIDILGGLIFVLSVFSLAVGVLIAILEAIYISSVKRKP